MNREINVIVYGMTENVGGMEMFFMNYYRRFDHTKVHFTFVSVFEHIAFEDEFAKNGEKMICIPTRSHNIRKNHKALRNVLKDNKRYDIAYMMALEIANIDFLKFCKKAGIPIRILHSHNSFLHRNSKARQVIAESLHFIHRNNIDNYATDYWACSNMAAKWMFSNRISGQIRIVHNAINTDEYAYDVQKRIMMRKKLGYDPNLPIYGFVGRLASQKNPLFLTDVFCEIIRKEPNAICILVGEGPMRPEIEEKIRENNMEDKMLLLGAQKNVNEYLQAIDEIVFPSLYEGLSLVMVEAQASGLPIVASDKLSEEHSITDLIKYISLEKTATEWADEAIKHRKSMQREITTELIIHEGYDIATEAQKLTHYLCGRLDELGINT